MMRQELKSNTIWVLGDSWFPTETGTSLGKAIQVLTQFLQGEPVIFNFESSCQVVGEGPRPRGLVSDPSLATQFMESVGAVAVLTANNHTLDSGKRGFEGLEQCAKRGLRVSLVGRREPSLFWSRIVAPNGLRISVGGAAWGGTAARNPFIYTFWFPSELCRLVNEERRVADRVILLLHWGYEQELFPLPAQRIWANLLGVAGADLIVGTHPHVPQGIEKLGNTVVAYSVGNCVFPLTGPTAYLSGVTKQHLALRVDFSSTGSMRVDPVAIVTDAVGLPVGFTDGNDLVGHLSQHFGLDVEEYNKRYLRIRRSHLLPVFSGSKWDAIRPAAWVGLNTGIHVAARLGMRKVARRLIRRGEGLNGTQ